MAHMSEMYRIPDCTYPPCASSSREKMCLYAQKPGSTDGEEGLLFRVTWLWKIISFQIFCQLCYWVVFMTPPRPESGVHRQERWHASSLASAVDVCSADSFSPKGCSKNIRMARPSWEVTEGKLCTYRQYF